MPGFFTRFANRLWRAERYARGLTSMLQHCVEQIEERGEGGKELVIINSPLLPEPCPEKMYMELNFLKRSAVEKTPALGKLFSTKDWGAHIKERNVTISLPKPKGRDRDLYFVASYDQDWNDLDFADLRAGLIQGVAVVVHEAMDDAVKRR